MNTQNNNLNGRNRLRHQAVSKSRRKSPNRYKWILLIIAALLLPPLYFVLAGGDSETAMEIVSFEELDDDIANQLVPYGTSMEDLDLPESLAVVIKMVETENEAELLSKLFMTLEAKDIDDEVSADGESDSGEDSEEGIEALTQEGTPEADSESSNESTQEPDEFMDESAEEEEHPDEGSLLDGSELETEGEDDAELETLTEETDESEPKPLEDLSESEEESEIEEEESEIEEEEDEIEEEEDPEISDEINLPDSLDESTFTLVATTIDVTWASNPAYDGTTPDIYIFTPIIPEEYIVSAAPPTITVAVMPMMKNSSAIRVTNRDELRQVFSHGAIVGGSLNWNGERLVEMAFSNLGGEINSHENFWSIVPIGTTRTITLVSADDEFREIKTTRNNLHFRIGPQVVLRLVDPNLHIVGNNPVASVNTEMAGGIRVQGGRLELWEGTIRENFGFWGTNAVYITAGGSFMMRGGVIENNRSDFGGGMSASGIGTKFDMYDGVFQNNFATIYSGGVDIDAGAEFNMYGGKIINNTADGEGGGGGLRVDSGSLFNMHDGLIDGNRVTSSSLYPTGGGVSVYDPDTTFNMNGGIISNNSAHRGGGVGVVNAVFNLGTGRTERGRATDSQTGTVSNPQIVGNHATSGGIDANLITGGFAGGGGVYVLGTSGANLTNFIMHSGRIEGNDSVYRGGGVYLISAIMNMKGGAIAGNSTTNNSDERSGGGGVYLHNYYADWGFPSKFIMRGGIIRGNESREGGAIKRNDYRLVIDISGCSVISSNTAHTLGGGISTETTSPTFSAINTFNIDSGRSNLVISDSVRFERNRSLAPVSYGLKVSDVRAHSNYMFGRIRWNGKNSVNGLLGVDSSFHLFNNHDIANLMGTPINFEDIEENSPNEPNLVISKTLRSDDTTGLDFANREVYFDFSVTITKSECNPDAAQKYRAYIMDEKGVVVNVNENFEGKILTDPKYGSYIEFAAGIPTKVRLKHGQWLSFVDIERDAAYTVTEYKSPGVTQSCVQKVNGAALTHNAPQEADLTIPVTKITDGEDRADFVNTTLTIVPVGHFSNSLPFVSLLCVVLLALVVLVGLRLASPACKKRPYIGQGKPRSYKSS